jgi:hypothetical protein
MISCPSRRRSRATYVCTVARTRAGIRSGHTCSANVSVGTARPTETISEASSTRMRPAGITTGPLASVTSHGPNTWNRTSTPLLIVPPR